TCGGPGQPPCSTPPPVGVPEPLTLSIFGAGFAALAVVRRRNKIRNA
ncbi:MAG: PEP-CTERM sorting domain-containing protein, partial [Alphaproteobacteria bacterium]|nr:PEP-CTERM sorting domain-containing protein [Alphaproteobacteria bacterium]